MRLQIDDGDHIVVRGESPFSLRVAPRVVFAMTSSCLMPMKTLSHRLLRWSRTALHEPLDTGDRAAVLRTQAYDRLDHHALHFTHSLQGHDLGPSEFVGGPDAEEVDILGARGFEKSCRQEVDVGGVDGDMRSEERRV